MDFKNNLIIKKISLDLDEVKDLNVYPFNIESIKNFKEINFDKPVTFLVGDNGIGKSTFIEALAVALGLPSEVEHKILDMKQEIQRQNLQIILE